MNTKRWERRMQHDKRLAFGDDYAGDAWFDTLLRKIKFVAPGVDPNISLERTPKRPEVERAKLSR